MNLSRAVKTIRVSNAVAAGTSDINSSSVDMTGYDAVEFEVHFGAIVAAAVTSVHLETSSDDSTFNDLTGTNQTVADDADNKIFRLDLVSPRERYIRCVVDRGTQNATVDSIVAHLYRANIEPIADDATIGGSEFHQSVAEGTI